jgi:hypothetical protein
MKTQLNPLSPTMHEAYLAIIDGGVAPEKVLEEVRSLLLQRATAPEDDLDMIDRKIVAAAWYYALRPDEIARRIIDRHGWAIDKALTVDQATLILAGLAEAGYPIDGNGAPTYAAGSHLPPVRGAERDRVIWDAARYWAERAASGIEFVSLGDARGYIPRPVQYDTSGSMHPMQQAALTFGPAGADDADNVRNHTRLLLQVRPANADEAFADPISSVARSLRACAPKIVDGVYCRILDDGTLEMRDPNDGQSSDPRDKVRYQYTIDSDGCLMARHLPPESVGSAWSDIGIPEWERVKTPPSSDILYWYWDRRVN